MRFLVGCILLLSTLALSAASSATNAVLSPANTVLYVRWFKVDTNIFSTMRSGLDTTNAPAAPSDIIPPLDPRYRQTTNPPSELSIFRHFLAQKGIPPPTSCFYNSREQLLIVRTTKENLEGIEKVLSAIGDAKVLRVLGSWENP